jgi:demethylmenaquinone methyltransferase/2-methoxy-6-polyprenyl-1,4-benzoquinol methylase
MPHTPLNPKSLAESKSPAAIRRMFHDISPSYDALNRALSLGIDQAWRRFTARKVVTDGVRDILDVCSGTGDLAAEFQKLAATRGQSVRVIGSDFTPSMMRRGFEKLGRSFPGACGAAALVGDTLHLPFPSASFDAVTVAFGIRNVQDTRAGLREMARVCRPGGTVAVLEFSHPRLPVVRQAYELYFHQILPRIGAWTTGTAAYRYLPTSVSGFPDTPEFSAMMSEEVGDTTIATRLTLGIATLYLCRKPA